MNSTIPESNRDENNPSVLPLTRRALLLARFATLSVAGVQSAAAESLDGKGNDVCPCFFDIDEGELTGDETLFVSVPCAVLNPLRRGIL